MALVLGLAGASLPATAGHDDVAADPAELVVEPRDGTELGDLAGESAALVTDDDGEPADDDAAPTPLGEAETGSFEADLPEVDADGPTVAPQVDPAEEPGELISSADASADDVGMVAPAAAGPDGAVPPYVYWTVEDAAGSPVGGASYQIGGPATWALFFGVSWGSTSPVQDCVSSPCAGPDLDPDPGEFLVKMSGSDAVTDGRRYRVRPVSAPGGYVWSGSTSWVELPGSRANAENGAWQNRTYDFGAFPVRQLGQHAPTCAAGAVYGLSADGYLREVSASGTVTNLGGRAGTVRSFNGLGIGYGGEAVYAYERTTGSGTGVSVATIWSFDTVSGAWTSTGNVVNSNSPSRTVQFVGGAVDLDTGKYYLGGFNSNGSRFRIWEYDPGTNTTSYTGEINTSGGTSGTNNGDIAFNAAGDLFVVRGSGTTTTVFSVTNEDLQAASGGLIPSAQSASVTTMSDVNGVAFDADGRVYLGSGSQLRSFAMPDWSDSRTEVTSGLNSTDLASCSSPPTITLEKYVEGERVNASDQFRLELRQGTQSLGAVTTTGNQSGLQAERVGPLPTVRNVQLTFSETAAGTANVANYTSRYTCTLDGEPLSSGTGTTGTVTIPTGGQEVVCTFRNAPLIADVTLFKYMTDRDGADPEPHPGWTVGMAATATTGQVTSTTPVATTQLTDAEGKAAWTIRFNSQEARATVDVSELMQPGYETAQDAVCSVNGSEYTFAGTESSIPGVAPGDEILCAFTNKPSSATLQVDKQWLVDGTHYAHVDRPGGLTADLHLLPVGQPDETPQWGQERTGFVIGDEVTINETTGIDDGPFPGCRLTDSTIVGPGLDGTQPLGPNGIDVTLPGASNHYTVTNVVTCQSLTLVKDVDNHHGGTLVADDWNGGLFAQADGAPQLVFDSDETKYVTTGSYALSERDEPGYELATLTCEGGTFDSATGQVTLADGESATCTFVNTDVPGSVTWSKVVEGTDDVRLAGSEWQLTHPDGSTSVVVDCIADDAADCQGVDRDPAAGAFRLVDLHWGEYSLVETKAPPGYVLHTTAYEFTIAANALDVPVGAIGNIQHDGPDLPLTGGLGRDHVYLAGSLALLLSLTVFGATKLHQRRHPRSVA